MKVLLALPRFAPNTNPPLGLAYIASYMRSLGHDVEILDPTFEGKEFAEKRLRNPDYGILGISAYTMNFNKSVDMCRIAKEANKDVFTVIGGVHPTIMPEESLEPECVDAIAIGEGEQTFSELASEISKANPDLESIKGLFFKKGEKEIKNELRPLMEDLDSVPFPARDLLPMEQYLNASLGRSAWAVKQPSTSIITSRGCPFQCTYCSSHLMFGRKTRFRSPQNVIDEIEQLKRDYKIRGLSIIDDTFTLGGKRVGEFCELVKLRKFGIEWICNARVDTVNEQMLNDLSSGGCVGIAFGVESGDQEILDKVLKKGITLEKVKTAFALAHNAGLETDAYFMLGIPGETLEQMEKTIQFAKEIKADYANFQITRPMPFTEMFDMAKKYGVVNVKSLDDYDFAGPPIYSSNLANPEEIKRMQKRAYKQFYFNPQYIIRQFMSVRKLSDLRRKIKGLGMVMSV